MAKARPIKNPNSFLAAVLGTGVYEIAQTARRQTELASFQEQSQKLQQETDQARQDLLQASNQIAKLQMDNARMQGDLSDLHRLRAEVTALRAAARTRAENPQEAEQGTGTEAILRAWLDRTESLKNLPILMPDKSIPELALLTEEDWLELARTQISPGHVHFQQEGASEDEDANRRQFNQVRLKAKNLLGGKMSRAIRDFAEQNDGLLPSRAVDLLPFLSEPVNSLMVERYEVVRTGRLADLEGEDVIFAERAPVDPMHDRRMVIGKNWYGNVSPGDSNFWSDVDPFQDLTPERAAAYLQRDP